MTSIPVAWRLSALLLSASSLFSPGAHFGESRLPVERCKQRLESVKVGANGLRKTMDLANSLAHRARTMVRALWRIMPR